MSGKKFMLWFAVSVVVVGVGISAWIKQGYDTRPNIEQQKQQEALQAQPVAPGVESPADTQDSTK